MSFSIFLAPANASLCVLVEKRPLKAATHSYNLVYPSLCSSSAFICRLNSKRDFYRLRSGALRPASRAMLSMENELLHDLAMGLLTGSVSLGCLKFWDVLAQRNLFERKVSRKLVHISIGLIFMLFWPLFSDGHMAPYLAALSPGLNTMRVLAIGVGIWEDEAMIKSMTREGNRKELVKGPFYYGATITLVTICLWRASPLAPVIVANLCAGDGFADLIGRRFGSIKLPFNTNKSYVGSISMFIFGFLFSLLYQAYFCKFGFYNLSLKTVLATMVVSFVTTFVESLPVSTRFDDNLMVPLTSFIMGSFLF